MGMPWSCPPQRPQLRSHEQSRLDAVDELRRLDEQLQANTLVLEMVATLLERLEKLLSARSSKTMARRGR